MWPSLSYHSFATLFQELHAIVFTSREFTIIYINNWIISFLTAFCPFFLVFIFCLYLYILLFATLLALDNMLILFYCTLKNTCYLRFCNVKMHQVMQFLMEKTELWHKFVRLESKMRDPNLVIIFKRDILYLLWYSLAAVQVWWNIFVCEFVWIGGIVVAVVSHVRVVYNFSDSGCIRKLAILYWSVSQILDFGRNYYCLHHCSIWFCEQWGLDWTQLEFNYPLLQFLFFF